jgi:hypothetical protein
MTDIRKLWNDEEEDNDDYFTSARLLALLNQWIKEDVKYGTTYCEDGTIKEIMQKNINQKNTSTMQKNTSTMQTNTKQEHVKGQFPPKPTYVPIQNAWRKMPVIK